MNTAQLIVDALDGRMKTDMEDIVEDALAVSREHGYQLMDSLLGRNADGQFMSLAFSDGSSVLFVGLKDTNEVRMCAHAYDDDGQDLLEFFESLPEAMAFDIGVTAQDASATIH